jgi:hypothetical protein
MLMRDISVFFYSATKSVSIAILLKKKRNSARRWAAIGTPSPKIKVTWISGLPDKAREKDQGNSSCAFLGCANRKQPGGHSPRDLLADLASNGATTVFVV